MDAFGKVDELVAKPVLGSDGAKAWQDFAQRGKGSRPALTSTGASKAPKAPLKRQDRAMGYTSWQDEKTKAGDARQDDKASSAGYTHFKKKQDGAADGGLSKKQRQAILNRVRPDKEAYYIKSDTFAGSKFNYVFSTKEGYGTGYFWDGTDRLRALDDDTNTNTVSNTLSNTLSNENAKGTADPPDTLVAFAASDEPLKKKRKKKSKAVAPTMVHDPSHPLEQVAAALAQRRQQQQQQSSVTDPTLPEGWQATQDPTTRQTYYYQAATGERTWTKPTGVELTDESSTTTVTVKKLPEGWTATVDAASGQTYYYHAASQKTQWDKPVVEG
jgi:hypothetical protein